LPAQHKFGNPVIGGENKARDVRETASSRGKFLRRIVRRVAAAYFSAGVISRLRFYDSRALTAREKGKGESYSIVKARVQRLVRYAARKKSD
jgi:hypothetical protein